MCSISYVKALAAGGSRVALYGDYGPDHDRLAVSSFDGDRVHVTGEYRLTSPAGRPLPTTTQVIGRGSNLHLVTDNNWYGSTSRISPLDTPVSALTSALIGTTAR